MKYQEKNNGLKKPVLNSMWTEKLSKQQILYFFIVKLSFTKIEPNLMLTLRILKPLKTEDKIEILTL